MRIRSLLSMALLLALGAQTLPAQTPAMDPAAEANSRKAHAVLDAMIKAMGGAHWISLTSWQAEGTLARFDHGRPEPETVPFVEYNRVVNTDGHPAIEQRVELGKRRDIVQLFTAHDAWEVTYKGKAPLPNAISQEYFDRRAHSLFTLLHDWLPDAKTLFLYEGQSMVERRQAEKITIISPQNISTTLEIDAYTHYLLRLSFDVQNPAYGDLDHYAEEYDSYHDMVGIATALRVTLYKNGSEVRESYITHVGYNDADAPELYDLERTVARMVSAKKKK